MKYRQLIQVRPTRTCEKICVPIILTPNFSSDVLKALQTRFHEIQETVWWSGGNPNFLGSNVCDDAKENNGFITPYQTDPVWPPANEV